MNLGNSFFYFRVEGKVPNATIQDIVTLITLFFGEQPPENYSFNNSAFTQLIDFLVAKKE
jgi:hypothetical protein